jgi:hypothetical protein
MSFGTPAAISLSLLHSAVTVLFALNRTLMLYPRENFTPRIVTVGFVKWTTAGGFSDRS